MHIYMYIYESICILAESIHAFTGVVEHHACAGVYVRQMLWISAYTFDSRSLQDVHMRYVYTCVYAYVYVYIYMCMHVYIYICMYVYTYIRIYAYIYGCVYVCVCMYVCICMYMYVYVCVFICICLYIAFMCSLFHLAFGNKDGGVQLVYESACWLCEGLFLPEGK